MANPTGQNQISLEGVGLVVLISSFIGESDGSKSNKNSDDYAFLYTFHTRGTENKLNNPTSLVLDQLYLGVTANIN